MRPVPEVRGHNYWDLLRPSRKILCMPSYKPGYDCFLCCRSSQRYCSINRNLVSPVVNFSKTRYKAHAINKSHTLSFRHRSEMRPSTNISWPLPCVQGNEWPFTKAKPLRCSTYAFLQHRRRITFLEYVVVAAYFLLWTLISFCGRLFPL